MANPFDDLDTPRAQGNPFDQFDEAGANPFDQFDAPRTTAQKVGRGAGLDVRELIEGATALPAAIASLPGAVYNIGADALQGKGKGFRFEYGPDSISKALDAADLPNPETAPERVVGDVVRGVGGVGSGLGIGNTLSRSTAPIVRSVGEVLASSPGGQVVASTAGNTAAGTARELGAPPLVQFGVGTLGAVAPTAVAVALRAGAQTANNVTRKIVGPVTDAGAQRMAGERIASSASDPAALRTALAKPADELVPGSKPTTFQQTGDMGVGALERQSQTQFPQEFQQRRADQNMARRQQLDRLQDTGDPNDLVQYVKGRIRWFDEQTQQDVDAATNLARERATGLGGTRQPEDYGADLRQGAQQGRDRAKVGERALWQAIDPDGNLTIETTPLREAAGRIRAEAGPLSKPLEGEIGSIVDAVENAAPSVSFRDVGDLRSWVSDALRAELETNGQSKTYRNLTILRDSVESAINQTVERRVMEAPDEVRRGLSDFERSALNWQTARRAGRESAGAYDALGAGGVSSTPGTQSAVGRGPGAAAGDQGLPGQPTFDQAARERLNTATTATRNRADTFDRGPVGRILQNSGRRDLYKISDSGVPSRLFRPGAGGSEDVRAYRRAVPDEESTGNLMDYAAWSLRKSALREDGTLDPRKAREWVRQHQSALREFPDALRERIENAATASDVIAEAAANRRSVMDEVENANFSKLAGMTNSEDVSRALGQILGSGNRVQQMQALARATAHSAEARTGLRKAIADYMQNKFVSNTEAATSGETLLRSDQFQTFMRQNEQALAAVFSPEEIASLKAIAEDLKRANRSLTAVKIPGQSNTAQDLLAASTKDRPSILSQLMTHVGGAAVGIYAAGSTALGSIIGLVGARGLASFRQAGYTRVDQLVRDAMLHPELARVLLAKVPVSAGAPAGRDFVNALKRSAIFGATVGAINAQPRTPSETPSSPPDPQSGATRLAAMRQAFPWTNGIDVNVIDSSLQGDVSGRGRQLEFYPADESDNPTPGKPTIEIFGRNVGDSDLMGEILSHYLPATDPNVAAFRKGILDSMSDEQRDSIRNDYNRDVQSGLIDKGESFDRWLSKQGGDSFFRGYATGQWPAETYNREQIALYSELEKYLQSKAQMNAPGEVSPDPEQPAASAPKAWQGRQGLQDLMDDKRPLAQIKRAGAISQRAAQPRDGSRFMPAPAHDSVAMDAARKRVTQNPTSAQKAAGNYRHGHIRFQGLDIAMETPRGGERTGIGGDGKPWTSSMPSHVDYGFVKGTTATDGDGVDVYIGPDHASRQVFVIDQIDLKTGRYDEPKVVIGFGNQRQAERAYAASFSDGHGKERIGGVTPMSIGGFQALLEANAFKKRQPLDAEGFAAHTETRNARRDATITAEEARGALRTNTDPLTGERPKGPKALSDFRSRMGRIARAQGART